MVKNTIHSQTIIIEDQFTEKISHSHSKYDIYTPNCLFMYIPTR